MKIIVGKHARHRAKSRCISELLLAEMFRKAIRDVGYGKARQFPDAQNPGAIHTIWKGWEFVHAEVEHINPRTGQKLPPARYIITVFSTTAWHSLDGHITPKDRLPGDIHQTA